MNPDATARGDIVVAEIHPFYEAHRGAMEAAMRHRLDLAETMLRDRAQLAEPVIGDIERESYKAQLLTVPEAERLASGRQFMSPENRTLLREQAAKSHVEEYQEDFVYDFIEPGPRDSFEFGINYKA